MTVWAVALPWPLTWPAGLLGVAALAAWRWPAPDLAKTVLLSLPLWLVLLAARPSQVDTWLNLLPNLAYLYDHAALPRDGGAVSWSFLPGAPYNTQFVGYAVSLFAGRLVGNALSLFNAVLLLAGGMLLATESRQSFFGKKDQKTLVCLAFALAMTTALNPGFVPRVFLASYGEAPIAVALLFATSLGADLLRQAQAGSRGTEIALALVLCALVEIKQSALGLLLPFALTLLVLGLFAPGVRRGRWVALVAGSVAPSLALYVLYRWYVLGHFAVGELKMLPFAAWHLDLLPKILGGIAFAMFQKAAYFLAVLAMLAGCVIEARRRPWRRAAVILGLGAGLFVGFNAFLLFTYVAHFPVIWAVHAHSYFRYMSQLSLVVMLGLAVWLGPVASAWWARRSAGWRRGLGVACVGAVVTGPLVGAGLLRFDLDAPQPFLWDIGHRAAGLLHDGDRVALVVPGDGDDAVGSYLRGVLLFTEPRRFGLDFRSELAASDAALEDAKRAGFAHALVTCAGAGLAGLPAGEAGLLSLHDGVWSVDAAWHLPSTLTRQHFSAMLPRKSFCLN